jgi:hypothetical protein
MKIPLEVRDFAGGLRVMARFLIQSNNPHLFGSIESIVDTGSPTTILGFPDIKKNEGIAIATEKFGKQKRAACLWRGTT